MRRRESCEQPEPRFGAANIRDDQRFRYQVSQKVHSIDACGTLIHGHRRSGLGGEAAGKDTKSPEDSPHVIAQQTVTPSMTARIV